MKILISPCVTCNRVDILECEFCERLALFNNKVEEDDFIITDIIRRDIEWRSCPCCGVKYAAKITWDERVEYRDV